MQMSSSRKHNQREFTKKEEVKPSPVAEQNDDNDDSDGDQNNHSNNDADYHCDTWPWHRQQQ